MLLQTAAVSGLAAGLSRGLASVATGSVGA